MDDRRQHACSKLVHDGGRGPTFHPCPRNGTAKRDGEWYCWQHDPVRVKEREARRLRKQAEKDAAWFAKRQWRPDAEQLLREFVEWLRPECTDRNLQRFAARARELLGEEKAHG